MKTAAYSIKLWGGGVALSAMLFVPVAGAGVNTLAPGGVLAPSASGFPVGGTVLDNITDPFSNGILSGTLNSIVVAGDASNPYGGLTFVYQLSVSGNAVDSASQLSVSSFQFFQTDVTFNPSSGSVAPTLVSRSSLGDVVRFSFFSPSIDPGLTSDLLIIQTGAQNFQPGVAAVIDGQSINVGSLVPIVVPEPGTTALLISGFGAMAWVFRRNRQK
jgi:hypothetical protein